jgi:TonB family protein
VQINGALVTLMFTLTAGGQAGSVRITTSSGDDRADAAIERGIEKTVFPTPPLEVGGDIAYTALLHFE